MKPLLVLTIALLPLLLFAHGGGQTVQVTSGDYVLTLDAVSAQLTSGNSERINFEIERNGAGQPVVFTHVWVRIVDPAGNFLFAGNIKAAPAGFVTGISHFFPREGTYDITLRFLHGEDTVAEAELPVVVVGGETNEISGSTIDAMLFTAFGLSVLALIWFGWHRNLTKKTP